MMRDEGRGTRDEGRGARGEGRRARGEEQCVPTCYFMVESYGLIPVKDAQQRVPAQRMTNCQCEVLLNG